LRWLGTRAHYGSAFGGVRPASAWNGGHDLSIADGIVCNSSTFRCAQGYSADAERNSGALRAYLGVADARGRGFELSVARAL
jgi:hypothetical protein